MLSHARARCFQWCSIPKSGELPHETNVLMAFASSQAHGTYQPDAFVSYEDGKVLLRIGPRAGSTHLRRAGKADTRCFISLIKQSLERLSPVTQTTMPPDGRKDRRALLIRERKLAGQPVEDVRRNARASKLMRLTRLVLGCLANIMQKRRSIHHVAVHATTMFQVQCPRDASGIHKVADSMTAEHARLLKLLKAPIFPLIDLVCPNGIKPRHRRQPRFVRYRIRVFHTPSPFEPLSRKSLKATSCALRISVRLARVARHRLGCNQPLRQQNAWR